MKVILFFVIICALSACGLEKSVFITTRGYEPARQRNYPEVYIKSLQNSDAVYIDTIHVYHSRENK